MGYSDFLAELKTAVQADTLGDFIDRYIQKDPARYYVHNGEYCGYNVQLGLFVLIVLDEADVVMNWSGEYVDTLPEHIYKALYQYGLQVFNFNEITPEDIIEMGY